LNGFDEGFATALNAAKRGVLDAPPRSIWARKHPDGPAGDRRNWRKLSHDRFSAAAQLQPGQFRILRRSWDNWTTRMRDQQPYPGDLHNFRDRKEGPTIDGQAWHNHIRQCGLRQEWPRIETQKGGRWL